MLFDAQPENHLATGSQEHSIAQATGFFWKRKNRTYLITNWHVLCGREPETGQPKNGDGLLPDRVRFPMWKRANIAHLGFFDASLKNFDGSNCWLEHPKLGCKIDIAALRIPNLGVLRDFLFEPYIVHSINNLYNQINMAVGVGSDVFVLGFPYGMRNTGVYPIWKRGSVATEFDYPVKELPCFLVDTATREGMSGSPVIQRAQGMYLSVSGCIMVGEGKTTRFLGVYSGRYIGQTVQEAQLGIVWKPELIEEILQGQQIGSSEL